MADHQSPSRRSDRLAEKHGGTIELTVVHDAKLADFGYEQELKRSFSLIGMIGFAFSIVTSWSALGGVLVVSIVSGGPPVIIWGWIGVCTLSLCVAYSFAEMCSAFPVAGGQYSWVAILAPPKHAKVLAWITGWFMNTGLVAMGATSNFIAANFILGMANLNNPDYVIERWHTVLLSYLIAILAGISNIFCVKWFNRASSIFLWFNILSFFAVVITVLATNDNKQSARFVFVDFQNATGFSSAGMATMIGLLQPFFGMCCYDAPSKMAEEMKHPSTEAPKAIIASVYIGAITGFIFLVSILFCVGDIEAVATSTTGVPLIQIFFDSTKSIGGATVLAATLAIVSLMACNSLMAEGSRGLWAFSRDHGLPFSKFLVKVDSKFSSPINSIVLCTVIQMILNSIYFASFEGFSTVIALSTFGFYLSYAMVLFVRLLSLHSGRVTSLPGPYSLGKLSLPLNWIGLVGLTFSAIVMNFPQVGPVEAGNMNYCSAAFGAIALISVVTWIVDGRKNFTGPQTTILDAVDISQKTGQVPQSTASSDDINRNEKELQPVA